MIFTPNIKNTSSIWKHKNLSLFFRYVVSYWMNWKLHVATHFMIRWKRDFIKATAWSCSAFIRQSLGSGRRAVPKCHKKSDAKKDQIVCLHFICISCMLSIKWSYKQIKVQMLCVQPLCFGAQSIKHANVLSEKNRFSALGGPKVAMFGGDDLDPLYFDVSNFSVTPDPPYMSKNAKMCYF